MIKDIVLIKTKEIEEMIKILGFNEVESLNKNIIAKDDKFNRRFLETNRDKIIFDLEPSEKDSFHQRNSGLNDVLCKIAKEHNIIIGFSLKRILLNNPLLLGKIMQNIRLCRKYKVKMKIASLASSWDELRSSKDIIALARVLGMTPLEAKNSVE